MVNTILKFVARLVAHPEKTESLKELLRGIVEATGAEKGCIKYQLRQNQGEPTYFTLVEEWETQGSNPAHLASQNIQAALKQLDALVAAKPDIRRYNQVK